MDTITKTVRSVVLGNLIIFGLAACASSPAPWTQNDDSPWGAKRAAEESSVPSDDAITADIQDEPVMLDEPAPMAEPEPMMYEPEPEVIAAPVVIAEQQLTPEQEVMAMPGSNYAVQVYASKTTENVEKFKINNDVGDLTMVKTDRSGSIVYVLVDIYADKASATAAAADLEAKTGSKPWVRSLSGLQAIIAE